MVYHFFMVSFLIKLITRSIATLAILMSGLVACIKLRVIPQFVSELTSIPQNSTFNSDSFRQVLLFVRDFTVGDISQEDLANKMSSLSIDPSLLSDSMISHLKDCTILFHNIESLFLYLIIALIIVCILSLIFKSTHLFDSFGLTIKQSSKAALAVIIALGIWICCDFNGFFTFMHSLFFASGTWTFDANSLLIMMFPTNFWIGMGVAFALISSILAIVLLVITRNSATSN